MITSCVLFEKLGQKMTRSLWQDNCLNSFGGSGMRNITDEGCIFKSWNRSIAVHGADLQGQMLVEISQKERAHYFEKSWIWITCVVNNQQVLSCTCPFDHICQSFWWMTEDSFVLCVTKLMQDANKWCSLSSCGVSQKPSNFGPVAKVRKSFNSLNKMAFLVSGGVK